MENAREPLWWMPLARRILSWGVTSMLMSGLLPFLMAMLFLNAISIGPIQQDTSYIEPTQWEKFSSSVWLSGICASPFLLLGIILGAAIGSYAPPTEPKNLRISPFFRFVAARTMIFSLLTFVPIALTLYNGFAHFNRQVPFVVWAGIAFVAYLFSLYFSLNRALHTTKLK